MGKIIVNQLELKNFFSYGNNWQTIDIKEGVNIVLGHDKDMDRSNGAGKTSFLEAIPFALFGQTSKGVALPKIINWKNGKQCEVRLHFEKDGVPYILHRGIKPGKLELTKDGVIVPKLSDKRVFQMELENDLIGMDFKAAQTLLFQNANNMISMFNTPKADKRRFIEKFFNLEVYSQVNEIVNGKLGNVIKKIDEIQRDIEYKQKRIDDLVQVIDNTNIPNIEEYEKKLEEVKGELVEFDKNNTINDHEEENIQQEITRLTTEKNELLVKINEFKDEKNKLSSSISLLSGEKTTHHSRIQSIGDLTEQKEKLQKVKTALKSFEGLDSQLDTLKLNKDKLTQDRDEISRKIMEIDAGIKHEETELSKWVNHSPTDSVVCPTCFQDVDPEHIKSHIITNISGIKTKIKSLSEIKEALVGEKDPLVAQISEIDIEIVDITKKMDKVNQLEKHLISLSGVDEKEKEVVEIRERLDNIETEMSVHSGKMEDVEIELTVLNNNFSEIDVNIQLQNKKLTEHNDLVHQRERLVNSIETEQKIYDNQKEIYDRISSTHRDNIASKSQIEKELGESSKEIEKLQTMKDYLEYIKLTLKDENVKQYAISNIIPYLQQQTNHYLSETGHNYYVELDAWLDGTINGYGVGDCDFGNMSGGEGKSIDLALKFAMMDVARRQAGSYLDVLVLDELLDSSIDSFGIEKTFDIIKMKQREDRLKVFVVSHREEVVDFGGDSVYRVTKEDGFSTIGVV